MGSLFEPGCWFTLSRISRDLHLPGIELVHRWKPCQEWFILCLRFVLQFNCTDCSPVGWSGPSYGIHQSRCEASLVLHIVVVGWCATWTEMDDSNSSPPNPSNRRAQTEQADCKGKNHFSPVLLQVLTSGWLLVVGNDTFACCQLKPSRSVIFITVKFFVLGLPCVFYSFALLQLTSQETSLVPTRISTTMMLMAVAQKRRSTTT